MEMTFIGNIVFFTLEAPGHIHPLLSIATELKKRNYRTIFLTIHPLTFAPRINALGHETIFCIDNEATQKESEQHMRSIFEPLFESFCKGPISAFTATYSAGGALDQKIDVIIKHHSLIEEKMRKLKPSLVIVDHTVGIPCATYVAPKWIRVYSGFPAVIYSSFNDNYVGGFGLSPSKITDEDRVREQELKKPVREKVKLFFEEMGVQVWASPIDMAPSSPYMNFCLGPEELSLDRDETIKILPETWFKLEHTLYDEEPRKFTLPEKISSNYGKLIYFSMGTLVNCKSELINRLLAILSKSPNRFIISKGQSPEEINDFPNMWGERYIDQKAVLNSIDLFITHGGHNSIIEAFYYGVPLIVLPIFADQLDGAQRIEDCGYGKRLNAFTCSEDELLISINDLLNDETLAGKMKKISSRLKSIRYDKIAADKIEEVLKM